MSISLSAARTGWPSLARRRSRCFMDVKLPGIDGVEAFFQCRKIRPQAKIMLMTGYSLEQLVARALGGGALGVLRKPFAMVEIVDVLQRITSQNPAAPSQRVG